MQTQTSPTPPRQPHPRTIERVASTIHNPPGAPRNNRRALALVRDAYDDGIDGLDLLKYGEALGLRHRHVRRAIAGKRLHGRIAHPTPGQASHLKRTVRAPGILTVLAYVKKAIDAGWNPHDPDAVNPLTEDEVRHMLASMRTVHFPRYNRNDMKLWRDPEDAEQRVRLAAVRRKFKNRRRLARATPGARALPLTPSAEFVADVRADAQPAAKFPTDAEVREHAAIATEYVAGKLYVPLAPDAMAPDPNTSVDAMANHIIAAASAEAGSGGWQVTFECGHTTTRPLKRRNGQIDPAPKWGYCSDCNGKPKRNITSAVRA